MNQLLQPKKTSTIIGKEGNGKGEFRNPSAVCVGKNDDYVVCDTTNQRIQVFDKFGVFIRMFGRAGKAKCEFVYPVAICMGKGDKSDLILVADFGNKRIQTFTSEGKYVKEIACNYPKGV